MEDLEAKVYSLLGERESIQQFIDDQKQADEQLEADLEALPGYKELITRHQEEGGHRALKVSECKGIETKLKTEILTGMTEKTHKFDCAIIQKRTTPKLQVLDGLKLFRQLDAKECIDSVKFLFNDKQVRTLIEGGAIKTGKACEITTSESLMITPTK